MKHDYVVALMLDGSIVHVWKGERYRTFNPKADVQQYRIGMADSAADAVRRATRIHTRRVSEGWLA